MTIAFGLSTKIHGHTTTASVLAWIWYVLSEHPDARERIEEECRTVLGGRDARMEDLPRLSDTRRVLEEVLRLYPPTSLTARSPTTATHRCPPHQLAL